LFDIRESRKSQLRAFQRPASAGDNNSGGLHPTGPAGSRCAVPVKPNTRSDREMNKSPQDYWKANIRLVTTLLVIWFVVSYLFGIILVDQLNAIQIGGVKLGFWFAQQGSIYVFVVLIFVYVLRMNSLDREFDVHED
jgi:putative solute:sodium symporter small subunit